MHMFRSCTRSTFVKGGLNLAQHAQTTGLEFESGAVQYLDGLYGYALTLTRNLAEAEDLVQETYLRALRAFEKLQPDSNLKSWLFTITRNMWLNQIRHTRNVWHMVDVEDTSSALRDFEDKSGKDPYDLYLTKVKEADVRNAIESLPPPYREVITLRAFEDLSYCEIARVLGCPLGTVMSRLSRARGKLKELLKYYSEQRSRKSWVS
jgi:RNA polymerase sigma-70 factor (ECF subfamily)